MPSDPPYTKLLHGIVWNTIGNLFVSLLALLIGVIQARYLDPAALGTYFLIVNIPVVLSTFNSLGFNQGLNRFVADLKGSGRTEWLLPLVLGVFVVRVLFALLTIVVFLSCTDTVASAFKIHETLSSLLLFLVACQVFLLNVNSILTLLLNMEYEQRRLNLLNIGKTLFTLAILLPLALAGVLTVEDLVLLAVLASLVQLLFCTAWMRGRYERLPVQRQEALPLARRFLRYSLVLYVVVLAGTVLASNVDIYFIGYFLTPASVSFYFLAFNLSTQLYQLVESRPTSAVLLSTMVERYKRGGLIELDRYFTYLLLFTATYALPIMLLGALLARPVVYTIYGAPYAQAAPILAALLVVGFVTRFGDTVATLLKVVEKPHYLIWTKLLAVLNIPLFLLLLPRLGLAGAVITTATTRLLTACVETAVAYRLVKVTFPARALARVLLAGLLMGGFVLLVGAVPLRAYAAKFTVQLVGGLYVYVSALVRIRVFDPEAVKYFPPLFRRLFQH